jgi:3-methyladenine DNA glycosylase AlkD
MTAAQVVAWIRRRGSARNVRGMARYGITSSLPVAGVSVGTLQQLARRLGRDHALALALWSAGWYESRMLAAFVDEPERVTRRQMDAWVKAFDNWAICDTICFHLFDRTPHAWAAVRRWSAARPEFVKRAAFALIASLAAHDKRAADARFRPLLPLMVRGASDERDLVRKGVSWGMRVTGRRSRGLHAAVMRAAERLAQSSDRGARWVGRDVLRDLARASWASV